MMSISGMYCFLMFILIFIIGGVTMIAVEKIKKKNYNTIDNILIKAGYVSCYSMWVCVLAGVLWHIM